jgi:hypothetical protein
MDITRDVHEKIGGFINCNPDPDVKAAYNVGELELLALWALACDDAFRSLPVAPT